MILLCLLFMRPQVKDDCGRTAAQRDYFTPLGLSRESTAARGGRVEWNDGVPLLNSRRATTSEILSEKTLWVERFKTPDVFRYLSNSNELEILHLQIRPPDEVCDLTDVTSIAKLRTLLIGVFSETCTLKNCTALAHCRRLEFVGFRGNVRISADNIDNIATSKTINSIHIGENCRVARGAISRLKNLPTLIEISLYRGTSDLLSELAEIRSLKCISFGFDTSPTLTTLSELGKLPNLKKVTLYVEEDERRESIRASLPEVKVVMLNDPR
jgi:hypothetical protein